MAKMVRKSTADDIVEEVVPMHLYKVTYRRVVPSPSGSRTKVFVTFGAGESDAINRVWDAYSGSSFQEDFDTDHASAEMILGDRFGIHLISR